MKVKKLYFLTLKQIHSHMKTEAKQKYFWEEMCNMY